jgi:phytoene/squalene synthetase
MKAIFDDISYTTAKNVTNAYSTSFSLATKMLGQSIRQDIYNIYGFVRFADEIVDTFHDYDKEKLFDNFEGQLYKALDQKISLNPILNAFQHTFHKHQLSRENVASFMKSMKLDLHKQNYSTKKEYDAYIYGSADVVGLMCLKVFVKGDLEMFELLKEAAMKLGSAFQKVNFLRDLKEDFENLNRTYFPNTNLSALDELSKSAIIAEIEDDFEQGYQGILRLPIDAKFGVFTAYRYYKQLLLKIKNTPAVEIKSTRIRISNPKKIELLTRSYVKYQLNML